MSTEKPLPIISVGWMGPSFRAELMLSSPAPLLIHRVYSLRRLSSGPSGKGNFCSVSTPPCGMVPFSDCVMWGRHCARWVWLNQGFVNSNSVWVKQHSGWDVRQEGEWYQNKYFKHSFIRFTYGSSQQNPACTSAIFYPQNSNFPWICERLWEKER